MSLQQFQDTAHAFDSVATFYDGDTGNNALVQSMRAELWRAVVRRVPANGRLLDIGCGTGIDAEYFARRGFAVTGIDASRAMVAQTRARTRDVPAAQPVRVENIGAHELERLRAEAFDGIYSDLGPLNCVPDLRGVARTCANLLKRKGVLIFSVMGRYCPWEMVYYTVRGDFKQARRRWAREMVPVNLNDGVVWTKYYTPREFFRHFEKEFQLVAYRGLNVFLVPPYLLRWYDHARAAMIPLLWLDAHVAGLPFVRDVGDHFLMTMRRQAD
jgi:SAM-dependent methyltransferase